MNWISVKDKLPEPKTSVLVFGINSLDGILIAEYRPESDAYRWDCDTFGMSAGDVTHWMPLPEPPK